MKPIVSIDYCPSPCGLLVLGAIDGALCLCDWAEHPCAERNKRRLVRVLGAELREAPTRTTLLTRRQIDEYFAGRRTAFSVPLHPVGTDFQQRVWAALLEIPYGQTRTYMHIAQRVGNPKGVRAVAQAIGANGIGIIIPCHRVIGSNRSLTGFAGGLEAKHTLLHTEGVMMKFRQRGND